MTDIGFTARSVAVMAAAYAAVVPLLEVPSGVLADRSSRTRMMACGTVALLVSSLLGGLSHNVPTYIAAAMVLGVYFAISSGTVDSIVYDMVIEETGSSDSYEMWIGRVRLVESCALVISALGGGVLAAVTSARATYFFTLPFIAVAVLVFLRVDEPRLHQEGERVAVRAHLAQTYRTMITEPAVRQVMLLAALVGLLSQAVFEFGPLWLVALAAPAALFGPYWAALVATLGIGAVITSKIDLDRRGTTAVLAVVTAGAAATLALTHSLTAVIVAQAVLALMLAIFGIHAGKVLHDCVPSNVRAGVSSGVGTLSWMLFLPFSLAFGWFAHSQGVVRAGWFFAVAAALIAILSITTTVTSRPLPEPEEPELACQQFVELVTGYLDGALPAEQRDAVRAHLDTCDGCSDYLHQVQFILQALAAAGPQKPV
ncbi:MFS transporter [Antrihabitans cavernicola]|uniref:MFS transporter n=2 Tax=Antrihabitans cavernicola TaxID=2495913 RepID=A0A5A7SCQ2_9NOCA|nr:MFS transporter [Spelaeibacter cavernicola]